MLCFDLHRVVSNRNHLSRVEFIAEARYSRKIAQNMSTFCCVDQFLLKNQLC